MFSHLDLEAYSTCLPSWLLSPHPLSLKLLLNPSTLLHAHYYHPSPGQAPQSTACLLPASTPSSLAFP